MTTMMRYSAGVWIFWLIYAGIFCEEDVGVCEQQPCQNGGICERHNNGFRCLCSQKSQNGRLYGGETCAVALSGCDDNRCENGGICSPLLVHDQHTYSCGCLAGFAGPRCQTPTTFSFEGKGGYLRIKTQVSRAQLRLTFSFRTRGPAGTLLQCRVDDLLLTVELQSGQLHLSSQRGQGSSITLFQELQGNVSNGEWHAVEASLGAGVSWIRLLCAVCQSLFLGATGLNLGVGEESPTAFRGCFRDVVVDSQLVVPRDLGPEVDAIQANVTMGCSDEDGCEAAPCGSRGRCVAQGWRSYRCVCHRPYQGVDCQGEYVTARFGADALESYAVFSLADPSHTLALDEQPHTLALDEQPHTLALDEQPHTLALDEQPHTLALDEQPHTLALDEQPHTLALDEQPHTLALDEQPHTLALDEQPHTLALDEQPHTLAVSMFVRTKHPSGLLLVLANSSSQYLRVWLEEGRVKVQVNNFEIVTGRAAADDGHLRLLTVQVEGRVAVLTQASQIQASVAVRQVQPRPGDRVFVGGLPDPPASAAFGGYFKGCVQDLRINGRTLQFFPLPSSAPAESHHLERRVHVTPGCGSDDACAGKPCLNGGVCDSTWDDFSCSCPPGTAGRRCEEVRWCELSPCPSSAVCKPLPHGFQCLSNVTLRGGASGGASGGGRCEVEEVDTCSDHRCSSGATCLRGAEGYGCLCPRDTTGRYCAEKRPEIPWYVETKPFPKLPVAECQGGCWNYSCFHGGTCSAGDIICHCIAGFTGHWCEMEVNECASDPCMHGGHCLDQLAGWECVCDQNYSGLHCQIDVSDFHLYLFLALWQNFFQLLSYQVWHMDDGPEIEWANQLED